ncbi:MAG: AbrB/MazE/SpoVT family DNA-binding domain-containing protein [Bacteroidaceae bacterium]|nr:AbrB/MazE/SpoVT family DNA-binding domain-containing protein [Bacteroidaceae bacterium]
MQTSIIKIGNSNGIILPADLLKSLNLGFKSLVSITTDDGSIVIKPATRAGWATAASLCNANDDDQLSIPDVLNEDKFVEEEWTW